MKFQPAAFTTALVLALTSGACAPPSAAPGSGGSSGTGATTGSGGGTGAGTGGAGATCTSVSACAGNVQGTWTAMSSCLKVGGKLDISLAGLDPRTCTNPTVSGGTLSVTGSFTANADGTYTDGTTTTGTIQIALPAGCLMLSGTMFECEGLASPLSGLGFKNPTCVSAAGGGCDCTCPVQQEGGLAWPVADPQKAGNYETSGNELTNDGLAKYDYCVAGGNTLTVTPKTTNWMTTGTIVFQKGSSAGTGGAPVGTGGGTGSGGATGSGGGSAGRGGNAATGGAGGRGGTTAGTGGAAPASGGAGGAGSVKDGPCDIYMAANVPCVAAYSMVRVLSKAYTGALYQVRSMSNAMNTGSGGMMKDIGSVDGFADTATQDAFCMGTTCTVSLLYDQSGRKNNLKVAPKGLSNGGTYAAMDDFESSATKGMLMINGHKVYSLYMAAREGYRLTAKGAGVPVGNTSEGIYMLADGTHFGTACCWDFGNVSTDPTKYGVMNTLFFGTGFWGKGAGSGPWFLGDFEGGVWAGGSDGTAANGNPHSANPSMGVAFAFGILKTSPGNYALRMGDLTAATALTTAYDGKSPKTWNNEGGLLLGIGGDNSNNSWGTFYEGAITAGLPSNDTDLAVFNNVKAVGYKK